jgi:hypothetical protein
VTDDEVIEDQVGLPCACWSARCNSPSFPDKGRRIHLFGSAEEVCPCQHERVVQPVPVWTLLSASVGVNWLEQALTDSTRGVLVTWYLTAGHLKAGSPSPSCHHIATKDSSESRARRGRCSVRLTQVERLPQQACDI